MKLMTAQQAARKWNTSLRNVQDLCKRGRVEGAVRIGRDWMIPETAVRPTDGRRKESREHSKSEYQCSLARVTPFLDMTDLYHTAGHADMCIDMLKDYEESQLLLTAEIAYSRGNVDVVYEHVQEILKRQSGLYAVLSGGIILSACAVWKGDLHLWNQARKYLYEAPVKNEEDRDIVLLALASSNSILRNTSEFPEWFKRGCFERLHKDAQPAAKVFYVRFLLVWAQELAMGLYTLEDVQGMGLLKSIPYIVEPMISQMVADKIVMAEIYLRILCSVAYYQTGNTLLAGEHLDRAIMMCLEDDLYGPLVEHRRQLGHFLDDHLAKFNGEALKKVKALHKQYLVGWTKLHNIINDRDAKDSFSLREREVARLAAFGMSNAKIASRLNLSIHTVSSLVNSAKNKAGVSHRTELSLHI